MKSALKKMTVVRYDICAKSMKKELNMLRNGKDAGAAGI